MKTLANAEAKGTEPTWYNSLPESVKHWEATRSEAVYSYEFTASGWPAFHSWYFETTATSENTGTTATSAATNTASSSNGAASSSSYGGVLGVTSGVLMAITGAAGTLVLALAI